MIISKTKFDNLIIIKNKKFFDKRGFFKEIIRENKINTKFPFLVMSYSKKNVIRGLHIQNKNSQGKFVSVIKGKIFDVAIDLRKKSKTFGKYYSCILSEANSNSIFIPPGFAHGFQALDKENYVVYSCTKYRDKKSEKSINFNDDILKIKWPNIKKILSDKDKNAMSFLEFSKNLS
jgi:dTDP-4-dehydrorhamnose 3,5-epimerase|tara:strand:- start:752 stop:1279 length:528 start_codon:yes stop_codon:yes gene_type:complete